jgi:hypothetical protein
MAIILDLRNRTSHAGTTLVHRTSEHVVLADVFGIVKNLPATVGLNPWLISATKIQELVSSKWNASFWQKQRKPPGSVEGSTEVDLVLESKTAIVFVEVKMNSDVSQGTQANPWRNQLVRNLDVGFYRARTQRKQFALIYVTPDLSEPPILARMRQQASSFPANPGINADEIALCLHWSPWSAIGEVLAEKYIRADMTDIELKFVRDLLAYLCHKRLWRNSLPDEELFYCDKLYRPLQISASPFVPYSAYRPPYDQTWRTGQWTERRLLAFLAALRFEQKALLKIMADAGGSLVQRSIMEALPFLNGRTSRALGALKAHINAGCKHLNCAPILSEGAGSGDRRVHEINRDLGDLRELVIKVSQAFEIRWGLL